ncbi:MAG TPA: hypothetical protein PLK42_12685, partial [Casimicrobium sp.]|nr:hypothetical protein [Casimicrobium sp.]
MTVIPAKAGIQWVTITKRNIPALSRCASVWIPAFAGMTTKAKCRQLHWIHFSIPRSSLALYRVA